MTSTGDTTTGTHPVTVFAARLNDRLDEVATTPVLAMTAENKRETLVALARARAKFDALHLRLLADAETTAATVETGAATAGVWLATRTQQTKLAARSDLKLALALDHHPTLATGMAAGGVNTAQARVIVHALEELPGKGEFAVSADQRVAAERHLVDLAAHHDAKALKVLGDRIFEVICPELADAYEGKLLEAEEALAARKVSFTMTEDHQGICHFKGRMPAHQGAMLRKAIQSLTNPTRLETTAGSPIDTDLPASIRDGIALGQIIEAIDSHWLPTHGGTGATVVITMTHEQLLGKLDASGVCTTDTGHRITASEARRLACTAGIVPVVLGGKSVVLDVGTKRRFHTEAQRIALGVRDGGCTAQGCDVPAAMCQAHHDQPHSKGGATSVANGRLLCGHHHRRIHDPAYEHRLRPDNRIEFHRRT